MYRKHNPVLSLVALLLLAVILAHVCTGCAVQTEAATRRRFMIDTAAREDGLNAYVITDTETDTQYLFVEGYKCGGMVKLEG